MAREGKDEGTGKDGKGFFSGAMRFACLAGCIIVAFLIVSARFPVVGEFASEFAGTIAGVTSSQFDGLGELIDSNLDTEKPIIKVADGTEESYLYLIVDNRCVEQDGKPSVSQQLADNGWIKMDGTFRGEPLPNTSALYRSSHTHGAGESIRTYNHAYVDDSSLLTVRAFALPCKDGASPEELWHGSVYASGYRAE